MYTCVSISKCHTWTNISLLYDVLIKLALSTISGWISPVALLQLCHLLHHVSTSEPPHHLWSFKEMSSRTMAGDHCHNTCYLNSGLYHPTVCCWCTIPLLDGSMLQCYSSSGLLHSKVWVVQVSGVQNKDSSTQKLYPLSITCCNWALSEKEDRHGN